MAIKLVVGLGNPGPEHQRTRHNAGFWLAERYAESAGTALNFVERFRGRVGKTSRLWLLLPETYMNRSGEAVLALASYYKILPDEIAVAHDELDLLPGTVRMKKGGGNAGHNGLRDIHRALATPDFWRIRIGIGHPRSLNVAQEVRDFVLHAPRKEEAALIDTAIERALGVMPDLIEGKMDAAIMKLHSAA